jgi:hypothetical protein
VGTECPPYGTGYPSYTANHQHKEPNELKIMTRKSLLLRLIGLAFGVALVAGCVSNPAERTSEILRSKSITIICCDATSPAAIVSGQGIYAGALLGMGGGMLGALASRSSLKGAVDTRTNTFFQRAGKGELPLATDFIATLSSELKARGYKTAVIYPRGFDGYTNRYQTSAGEVSTELVLEIRHAGQIADYKERFLPTLAASFSVRRASDNATLNSGYVATRDMSIAPPPFGDPNIVRAPILNVMGPIGYVFKNAEFVTLDDSQLVHGGDSSLFDNAQKLYDGTIRANREMAKLLVVQLDQVKQ